MVYQIIQEIPQTSLSLTLFFDNLFTSILLFFQLKNQSIGIVGITKLIIASNDFSAVLRILKKSYSKV